MRCRERFFIVIFWFALFSFLLGLVCWPWGALCDKLYSSLPLMKEWNVIRGKGIMGMDMVHVSEGLMQQNREYYLLGLWFKARIPYLCQNGEREYMLAVIRRGNFRALVINLLDGEIRFISLSPHLFLFM